MDGGNECEKLPAKFSSTFIAHFAMRAVSTFYDDTVAWAVLYYEKAFWSLERVSQLGAKGRVSYRCQLS